jgi:hypothetical protein
MQLVTDVISFRNSRTVLVRALHVCKWRPLDCLCSRAATFTLTPDSAHCHCEADEVVINCGCWERGVPSVPVNASNSPNGSSFTLIQKYALSNFQLQTCQWQTLIKHRGLTQSSVIPSLCSRCRVNTCGKLNKMVYSNLRLTCYRQEWNKWWMYRIWNLTLVLWDVTPCSLVLYTSVSDFPHTSIFRI